MSFDLLATLGIIVLAGAFLIYRFRKPGSGCCGCSSCPADARNPRQKGDCPMQETLTPLDKKQNLTQK